MGTVRVRGLAAAALALLVLPAWADKTWSGGTSSDFELGANWTGGSAPSDDTTTDQAIFTGTVPNHPVLTADRSVKGLKFSSGTWTNFNTGAIRQLTLGAAGITNAGTTIIGTSAVLSVSAAATRITTGSSDLTIRSRLTGAGGLDLEGTTRDGNQRSIYLEGSNDFSGGVTVEGAAYVLVRHPNALGAKPGLVVTVNGSAGGQWSYAGRLYLANLAGTFATNVTEIILDGPKLYPAQFYQEQGTVVSNKITLKGGVYTFASGGSGNRYNNGEIVLSGGTTNVLDKSSGYGAWYQGQNAAGNTSGTITGPGILKINGYNSNDSTFYFNGSNTYSGGTLAIKKSNQNETYVGNNTAFGTGPVELQTDVTNKTAFTLSKSLTMTNAFRGQGKISTTASYVFTAAGSLEPCDTGLSQVTTNIGAFFVENLRFGSDGTGCVYNFQYTAASNDVIACSGTLAFGKTTETVNVSWYGGSTPPVPPAGGTNLVIFSYGSASHPDMSGVTWQVNTPPTLSGSVSLNTSAKQVILTLQAVPAPVISNTVASGVSAGAATLNAYLVTGGVPMSVSAFWGPTDGSTNWGAWANTNTFAAGQWGTRTYPATNISGLAGDSSYYYTFVATNVVASRWATPSASFITGLLQLQGTRSSFGGASTADSGTVTVYRAQACTNGPLTVYYTTAGSATNGVNYLVTPASGALTIPAGQTSADITLTPLPPWNYGGPKAFSVALGAGPYVTGANSSVSCILETAPATPPIISNRVAGAVTPSAATLNGALTSVGGTPATVCVFWGLSDAGTNRAAWANTNTFALGQWGDLSLPATNIDGLAANTTYYYTFYATNDAADAWAIPSQSFISGPVTMQALSAAFGASNSLPGTVMVYRASSCAAEPLAVNYATGGTATNGTDYVASPASGSLVIPAGQTNAAIVLTPQAPWNYGAPRVATFTLLAGAYATGANNSASCTLRTMPMDGVWTNSTSAGTWSVAGNWLNNSIANGPNAVADFTTVAIPNGGQVVNLDGSRSAGTLKFLVNNQAGSATGSYTISNATSILTLDTAGMGTPAIAAGATSSYVENQVVFDVTLAGSEGMNIVPLAGAARQRPVYLKRSNVFSGPTTIGTGAWLVAANNGALAAGDVTIRSGGQLSLDSDVALTNRITVESDGQIGVWTRVTQDRDVFLTNSTIALVGTSATFVAHNANLQIFSSIVEAAPGAATTFAGNGSGSNGRFVNLYAANTLSGPVAITNAGDGGVVGLYHPNGLGTGTAAVVINGAPASSGEGQLRIMGIGMHPNRPLWVGPLGILALDGGSDISNVTTLAGGTFLPVGKMFSGADTWHRGSIILVGGTTSAINRTSNTSSGGTWHQTGVISGAGAISCTGQWGYDGTLSFEGANTYSGGTHVVSFSSGSEQKVRCMNNGAFGIGPLWIEASSATPSAIALGVDCTLGNTIRGRGTITRGAGNYTVTAVGNLAPGDGGLDLIASNGIGTLTIEQLRFGNDTHGATYTWHYDGATNDIVAASSLQFGKTMHRLQCQWLGGGSAPQCTSTLFTYTGADPDMTNVAWDVIAPPKLSGRVLLDAAGKRVVVLLGPSTRGTAIVFR
jgi:hypothetical protein